MTTLLASRSVKADVSPADLDRLAAHLLNREASEGREGDLQVPGYFNAYNDPLAVEFHRLLLPQMEAESGLCLLPTYSYARIYRWGAQLTPHRDRPACQVSGTLLVATNSSPTWPIVIEGTEIVQEPGELAVYRGCEQEHWRPGPMLCPPDGYQIQLFVHYVDADGPYAEQADDVAEGNRRYDLGLGPVGEGAPQ